MTKYLPKEIQNKLRNLGLYQIFGGGVGVLLILWSAINSDLSSFLLLFIFLIMLAFFAYSIFCGILCIRQNEACLKHSLINQFLQLPGIAALGFAFQYAAGIYLHIGLDLTQAFEIDFGLGISKMIININSEPELFKVQFNIVAILLILWIEKTIRRINTEKQYREVEELIEV